jgi:protein-S-isoprenylcysteine O-methyltransferase Ste14
MFVLARALTFATLFIGFFLVFIPAELLRSSGLRLPPVGPVQIVGMTATFLGGALAVWCIFTFALVGRGTPAPFDPPRCLVATGPYQFVRNPMYLGAATALAGAALVYQSLALALYAGLFLIVVHIFVRLYEEPALRAQFGEAYDSYCSRVGRWLPRHQGGGSQS